MEKESNKWFSSWFNTPFYHILYKNRDDKEAENFMRNLTDKLNLKQNSLILDLACGKGRHSKFLNSIGYNVLGVDLSEESIKEASLFKNESLNFRVHDMTLPLNEKFDAVFNLFTSFGYFDNEEDDLNTLKSIKDNLNNGGVGVIDFMNVKKVVAKLIKNEDKTVEDIHFKLKRFTENGFIKKSINFKFEGENYDFQEKVKMFTLQDFQNLFKLANINLLNTFGNYNLEEFNENESDRLILVFN